MKHLGLVFALFLASCSSSNESHLKEIVPSDRISAVVFQLKHDGSGPLQLSGFAGKTGHSLCSGDAKVGRMTYVYNFLWVMSAEMECRDALDGVYEGYPMQMIRNYDDGTWGIDLTIDSMTREIGRYDFADHSIEQLCSKDYADVCDVGVVDGVLEVVFR